MNKKFNKILIKIKTRKNKMKKNKIRLSKTIKKINNNKLKKLRYHKKFLKRKVYLML